MAIKITPTMSTTFAAIFGQWDQYPSPFYQVKDGVTQQAWLRLNLVTRHIDVTLTAAVEVPEPRFVSQTATLAVPLPKHLTGMQMDRILNSRDGLMEERASERLRICRFESQDYGRENIHEILHYALGEPVQSTPEGTNTLQGLPRVLGLLKNVQLWLEDLAALNDVVSAEKCSLREIGLSGADDGGWQRKSMNQVTQLTLKSSGRRLADKSALADLMRERQEKPGVIYVGLRERAIRLLRLTKQTMQRLGDQRAELQVVTRPGNEPAEATIHQAVPAECGKSHHDKEASITKGGDAFATQKREEIKNAPAAGSTRARGLSGRSGGGASPQTKATGTNGADVIRFRGNRRSSYPTANGGHPPWRVGHRPMGDHLQVVYWGFAPIRLSGGLCGQHNRMTNRRGTPEKGAAQLTQSEPPLRTRICSRLLTNLSLGPWFSIRPLLGSTSGTRSSWRGWADSHFPLGSRASPEQKVAYEPRRRSTLDPAGVNNCGLLSVLCPLDHKPVADAQQASEGKNGPVGHAAGRRCY